MGFFSSIEIDWQENETRELYGPQAYRTEDDFSSKSQLKKHAERYLENRPCPECGSKCKGSGVKVIFGRMKLFDEIEKKGFFGKKTVSKLRETVWRIHKYSLAKKTGMFSSKGYLKCKKCSWKIEGEDLAAERREQRQRDLPCKCVKCGWEGSVGTAVDDNGCPRCGHQIFSGGLAVGHWQL